MENKCVDYSEQFDKERKYRVEVSYCPVCGCDLKDRATEKQERRDNVI